jgi:hypothetical protein
MLSLLDAQPSGQFPVQRYVFSSLIGEDGADSFEAGLDIILAGIEAIAGKVGLVNLHN